MTHRSLTTLITGLPRSGTTLTVALLNEQPNCIALAEPLPVGSMSADPDAFADEVSVMAGEIRERAVSDRTVLSRAIDGKGLLTGNFVTSKDRGTELRKSLAKTTDITIQKEITPEFRLYIKHPSAFSAAVDALSARFSLFACIRSPLAVLASWQTVDMSINRGRIPVAERLRPELAVRLDAIPDPLSRQVYLMGWFLEAYAALPSERILRFEDLVRDPHSAMRHICPNNTLTTIEVETVDVAQRYPSVDIDRLRFALRPIEDLVRRYYPEGLPY